jgi:adrenodoxin-NADP+ reductase
VLSTVSKDGNSGYEPGLYVVGWLKRGPTGIIGTNLICAEEVAMSIIKDLESGILSKAPSHVGREGVMALLRQRGVKFVSFRDWEKINAYEITEGAKNGRPREKLISVEDAVKIAGIIS